MSTTRQVFVGILTFMYLSIVAILFFLHCNFSFNITATLTILMFTLLVRAVLFCVDTNLLDTNLKYDGKKTAACSVTVTI